MPTTPRVQGAQGNGWVPGHLDHLNEGLRPHEGRKRLPGSPLCWEQTGIILWAGNGEGEGTQPSSRGRGVCALIQDAAVIRGLVYVPTIHFPRHGFLSVLAKSSEKFLLTIPSAFSAKRLPQRNLISSRVHSVAVLQVQICSLTIHSQLLPEGVLLEGKRQDAQTPWP